MEINLNSKGFALIYVILNKGMASKVLQYSKKCGIKGGTIFFGKGAQSSKMFKMLSLYEEKKEILMMGTDIPTAKNVLKSLTEKFKFEKSHHGIAFMTIACSIYGTNCYKEYEEEYKKEEGGKMYKAIYTIVTKGRAEEVLESARKAGSNGGTIINARGAGIHETEKLFNMYIEPEKEMVFILAKEEIVQEIVENISADLELDVPGNGIVFVQNIEKVVGIHEA